MTTENQDPLVPVHSCWGDTEAAIVVSFLHSRDIYAEASPQGPRSAFPLSVDGLGEIQILVEKGSVEEAQAALAERERGETSVD